MIKRTTLILCILAAASASLGRVWHVGNVNGNDANGGYLSPSDRLATIAEAVSQMSADDDIWIHNEGQVYIEALMLTNSGTSWENPVRVVGIGNPVLTGAIEPAAWTNSGGYIWHTGCPTNSYMVTEDGEPLTMVNEERWITTATIGHSNMYSSLRRGWTNDPTDTVNWPVMIGDDERVITSGTNNMYAGTFANTGGVLYVWCTDSNSPATHTMEVANRYAVCEVIGDYIEIKGINFRMDNQAYVNNWSGCRMYPTTRGAGIRFIGNTISNSGFIGMSVYSGTNPGSVWMEDCIIDRSGNSGLAGTTIDSTIRNCTFTRNNFHRFSPTWQSAGVKLTAPVMNVRFDHCTASNNYGSGFWVDIDPIHNVTFDGCISAYNYRQGFANEYGDNIRYLNCIAAFNYANGFYSEGGPNITVAHSVAYKNGMGGIFLSNYPRTITNSTITAVDMYLFARGYETDLALDYPGYDCRVVNSIIANNHWTNNTFDNWSWGAYQRQEIAIPATNFYFSAGRLSDYNVIWRDPSIFPTAYTNYYFDYRQGSEFAGITAWTNEGWDIHSRFEDPGFTDPDTLDFTVSAGSPAIGTAKVMYECEFDFDGVRRWKYTTMSNRTAGAYVDPNK